MDKDQQTTFQYSLPKDFDQWALPLVEHTLKYTQQSPLMPISTPLLYIIKQHWTSDAKNHPPCGSSALHSYIRKENTEVTSIQSTATVRTWDTAVLFAICIAFVFRPRKKKQIRTVRHRNETQAQGIHHLLKTWASHSVIPGWLYGDKWSNQIYIWYDSLRGFVQSCLA